jgi:hypothetical protein
MADRPLYIIRLRGPWQLEPIARFVLQPDGCYRPTSDDVPPPVRAKMPADWSAAFGGDFRGRVCYRRNFQMPTGLDEGQRVFLVIEPPRSRGMATLDGTLLGRIDLGGAPGRYDITDRMHETNRLEIVVDHLPLDDPRSGNDDEATRLPGGLVGEVRLEIEE